MTAPLYRKKSSEDAKRLIKNKLVYTAEQTDSINTLISIATSLLKNVDILVKQINLALEGNSDSEIAITLKELNQILVNVAAFTSDAQGLVPLLLEDKKNRNQLQPYSRISTQQLPPPPGNNLLSQQRNA